MRVEYIKQSIKDIEERRNDLNNTLTRVITPIKFTYYVKFTDMEYAKYLTLRIEEDIHSIEQLITKLGFFERFFNRKYLKSVKNYIKCVQSDLGIFKAAQPVSYNSFIARSKIEPFRSDINLVISNKIPLPA